MGGDQQTRSRGPQSLGESELVSIAREQGVYEHLSRARERLLGLVESSTGFRERRTKTTFAYTLSSGCFGDYKTGRWTVLSMSAYLYKDRFRVTWHSNCWTNSQNAGAAGWQPLVDFIRSRDYVEKTGDAPYFNVHLELGDVDKFLDHFLALEPLASLS